MNSMNHLGAPIDLNDAGPQNLVDEEELMLDFNEVEQVDEETARTIELEILREEENHRAVMSDENR